MGQKLENNLSCVSTPHRPSDSRRVFLESGEFGYKDVPYGLNDKIVLAAVFDLYGGLHFNNSRVTLIIFKDWIQQCKIISLVAPGFSMFLTGEVIEKKQCSKMAFSSEKIAAQEHLLFLIELRTLIMFTVSKYDPRKGGITERRWLGIAPALSFIDIEGMLLFLGKLLSINSAKEFGVAQEVVHLVWHFAHHFHAIEHMTQVKIFQLFPSTSHSSMFGYKPDTSSSMLNSSIIIQSGFFLSINSFESGALVCIIMCLLMEYLSKYAYCANVSGLAYSAMSYCHGFLTLSQGINYKEIPGHGKNLIDLNKFVLQDAQLTEQSYLKQYGAQGKASIENPLGGCDCSTVSTSLMCDFEKKVDKKN